MIRVVVADDQPLVRHAVRGILTAGGIDVVGEAVDGLEAVAKASTLAPDVVVMDIRMPHLDGIAATQRIRSHRPPPDTRVLVLTTFEEDAYVVDALRAGASGFIGKGAEPHDIVNAVRTIHLGEALLSPTATRALIESSVRRAAPRENAVAAARLALLTAREREVLVLVAAGRSNQEIAADLVISAHTAKTHVNRAMAKVDARDRAQLVILAYESGLVVAGDR